MGASFVIARDRKSLIRIYLVTLTLNVEQNTSVHRHRQRGMSRDAGYGGVVMSPQNLEMRAAAPTRRRRQHGEVVRRLFRSVQSRLRQGHAPRQDGRRITALGRAFESELRALLHRHKLIAGVQPAAVYQQIRPTWCLCNKRACGSISDVVTCLKYSVGKAFIAPHQKQTEISLLLFYF